MTLTDWLAKEKELLAKATPGPWYQAEGYKHYLNGVFQKNPVDGGDEPMVASCDYDGEVDAAFIAHVRTSHEQAIVIIERLKEALWEIRERAKEHAIFEIADKAIRHHNVEKL